MTLLINDKDYNEKVKLISALQHVIDPELGISIIDLGLIYRIELSEPDEILIEMTLSTPSCPLGSIISAQVRLAAEEAMPGYKATVSIVWEPKWNGEMISEEGRSQLGL